MILHLLPVGTVQSSVLNNLKDTIPQHLPFERVVRMKPADLPDEYDSMRQQYHAHSFFSQADGLEYDHMLQVTDVDTFVEPLNFVFGMAHPQKKCALISLHRLAETRGSEHDSTLFRERLIKESVHNIAHVAGLGHCKNNCVMRLSNNLMDLDAKPLSFCPSCSKAVKQYFRKK